MSNQEKNVVLFSYCKSLQVLDKALSFVDNSVILEENLGKICRVDKAIHSVLQWNEMVIPVCSCAGILLPLPFQSLLGILCIIKDFMEGWLSIWVCIRVCFALMLCKTVDFFFAFQL